MKSHLLLPIVVIVLALAFLDPFHYWMPTMLEELLLGLLVLATIFYGVVVFKEEVQDEREEKIRSLSHRVSYLISTTGLVLIIAYYLVVKEKLYPELVALLVLLIITKAAVHWYADRKL